MPALIKYSWIILISLSAWLLVGGLKVWARDSLVRIEGLKYKIKGKERVLKFKVVNYSAQKWLGPVKVEVLGERNKIKHVFVFENEVEVSAGKTGEISLRWEDEELVVGREKIRLYVQDKKEGWQKVGEATSKWRSSSLIVIPFGFLMGVFIVPGLLIRTSPSVLLNYFRKEVRFNAQRPA